MKEKDRTHLRVTKDIKSALDKHQKDTGSKSANDAIANLLGIDASKPKAKKPKGIYKEHKGVPASIVDAAILRCWELERIRDKTRAEIVHSVRESLERPYPTGTSWMSLYPR